MQRKAFQTVHVKFFVHKLQSLLFYIIAKTRLSTEFVMFNWSPKKLLKNKKQKQSHESRTALNIQKNNAIQKIPQSLALLHGSVWHWLQPHAHPILSNSEVSTQPKYDFWQREQMRSLWSREVRLISWGTCSWQLHGPRCQKCPTVPSKKAKLDLQRYVIFLFWWYHSVRIFQIPWIAVKK